MAEPLHIISLGAGVQSSTMALMAAKGEITPMPAAAIFADTQAEPASVYRWLDWLEKQLPFPVHRVTKGSLGSDALTVRTSQGTGLTYLQARIPYHAVTSGRPGMNDRHCTRDYKILPIQRAARAIAKTHGAKRWIQWVGISRDEAHRMKDSGHPLYENRWPLIELRMTRTHCLEWMEVHGFPKPPRSACTFCPYHSDAEWLRLKEEEPGEFAAAVMFERTLNERVGGATALRFDGAYLHASRVPLDQVDFTAGSDQLNLWGAECEGMCGV